MRASELKGRPIICLDRARRIGSVQAVILDPTEGRVAGLRIRTGLFEPPNVVPADLIYGIGPDAITIDTTRIVSPEVVKRLDRLPDLGHLGRIRVVTTRGEQLGPLRDALIDPLSLSIVGYEVVRPRLDELMYGRMIVLVGERIAFTDDTLVVAAEALGGAAELFRDEWHHHYEDL